MAGEPEGSRTRADVLVAHELRKSYGARRALEGPTFSLKAGRIVRRATRFGFRDKRRTLG
jgi:hypothetical protein